MSSTGALATIRKGRCTGSPSSAPAGGSVPSTGSSSSAPAAVLAPSADSSSSLSSSSGP